MTDIEFLDAHAKHFLATGELSLPSTPPAKNEEPDRVPPVGSGLGEGTIQPDQFAFDEAVKYAREVVAIRRFISRIGVQQARRFGYTADLRVNASMVRWWADEALSS